MSKSENKILMVISDSVLVSFKCSFTYTTLPFMIFYSLKVNLIFALSVSVQNNKCKHIFVNIDYFVNP